MPIISFKQYIYENSHEDEDDEYVDTRELDKHLDDHYSSHIKNNKDNKEAVYQHVIGSSNINHKLHNNLPLTDQEKDRSDKLSNAIKTAPKTKRSFTVYAGLRHAPQSQILHSKGFQSSSISPGVGASFAAPIDKQGKHKDSRAQASRGADEDGDKHILKIDIPKNTSHGIYTNDGRQYPSDDRDTPAHYVNKNGKLYGTGEQEYLLDKNKRYKIYHYKKIPHYDGIHATHVYHAKIID